MKHLTKLTLLHSNDMHGDFTAEQIDDRLVGGVSRLSGYINKVRREETNVLYTVSGDMFRGSLIDSEFRGISTIEIMNILRPDVATLGNHETDYGVAHLLFLEKCARFPIINANLYIKSNQVRLFDGHVILNVGGLRILFIGILTEEVLQQTKKDALIGSLVDVRDAAAEVGKICDAYRTEDIDLTVLLTHIGFEEDKRLAAMLDPEWGVDLIIGGHSHTLMTEPCVVAGIPIVQAATGTDQIGRFDILVDKDTNAIDHFTWQLVPINEETSPRDLALEKLLSHYSNVTDEKYKRYITKFEDQYTHPRRDRETQLGKLFADVFRDSLGVDIMLIGSGSFRKPHMGPIVDYGELMEMFPYEEKIFRVVWTGAQLRHALEHIFRPGALADSSHTELYQYSGGLRFECSLREGGIRSLTYLGEPVQDDQLFSVGLQEYHYNNLETFFDLAPEAVRANKSPRIIATSSTTLVEEWLCAQPSMKAPAEARWITIE